MNKIVSLAFLLLVVAIITLPLKAAEQCCAPCANGVLVGVTADSCGTCMDLAKFIPGCENADTSGCTTCKTGFTLTDGACVSAQAASISGLHCKGPTFVVTPYESWDNYSTPTRYGPSVVFIPNCTACASNGTGCATCAPGTTRTQKGFAGDIGTTIYVCL